MFLLKLKHLSNFDNVTLSNFERPQQEKSLDLGMGCIKIDKLLEIAFKLFAESLGTLGNSKKEKKMRVPDRCLGVWDSISWVRENPGFLVPSDGLGKPGIKPATPGLQGECHTHCTSDKKIGSHKHVYGKSADSKRASVSKLTSESIVQVEC